MPRPVAHLPALGEVRGFVAELRRLRTDYGRDRDPFEIKVSCTDVFDPDGFRRLADAGVTDAITKPWLFYGGDSTKLDEMRDGIRRFADGVISKVR